MALIRDASKEKISVCDPGLQPNVSSIRLLHACPMIGLQRIEVSENQSEAAAAVAVKKPRTVPSSCPKNKPKTVRLSESVVVGRFTAPRPLICIDSKEKASVCVPAKTCEQPEVTASRKVPCVRIDTRPLIDV